MVCSAIFFAGHLLILEGEDITGRIPNMGESRILVAIHRGLNTESAHCSPPVGQAAYSIRKATGGNMKLSLMIAMVTLVLGTSQGFARTQCTCQSVNAVGEGNSSCSTAESNGKCTVDFNQFPPVVLNRAADELHSADRTFSANIIDLNRDASFVLRETRDAQQLANTIVLYMAVAVTMQSGGKPVLDYESSDLQALIAFAKEKRNLFVSLFRMPTERGHSESGTYRSGISFTQAPGCMDIMLPGGLRVMFKARWSPAAVYPRCEIR